MSHIIEFMTNPYYAPASWVIAGVVVILAVLLGVVVYFWAENVWILYKIGKQTVQKARNDDMVNL